MNKQERKELDRDNAEWGAVFVGVFVLYAVVAVVVLWFGLGHGCSNRIHAPDVTESLGAKETP